LQAEGILGMIHRLPALLVGLFVIGGAVVLIWEYL
jgi:hypothetical protein